MTYFDKIRQLCKARKVKVSTLERDLGFGSGYISHLKDKIPTDRAVMIAEYLGLPSDYFMPEEIKKSPVKQDPLVDEIMLKASNLSEAELKELISFADYILSKR